MPDDRVLTELLRKFPEDVFKYHEHDSLLEQEDDLTEQEKDILWKKYEKEVQAHEAKLALENLLKMPQDAAPSLDSDAELNESDPILEDINGNRLMESPAKYKVNNVLTPEVTPAPMQKASPIILNENCHGTAASSVTPLLEVVPAHAHVTSKLPTPKLMRIVQPSLPLRVQNAPAVKPVPKQLMLSKNLNGNGQGTAVSLTIPLKLVPVRAPIASKLPAPKPIQLTQPILLSRSQIAPGHARVIAKMPLMPAAINQIQPGPSLNSIQNAVGVPSTSSTYMATVPKKGQTYSLTLPYRLQRHVGTNLSAPRAFRITQPSFLRSRIDTNGSTPKSYRITRPPFLQSQIGTNLLTPRALKITTPEWRPLLTSSPVGPSQRLYVVKPGQQHDPMATYSLKPITGTTQLLHKPTLYTIAPPLQESMLAESSSEALHPTVNSIIISF